MNSNIIVTLLKGVVNPNNNLRCVEVDSDTFGETISHEPKLTPVKQSGNFPTRFNPNGVCDRLFVKNGINLYARTQISAKTGKPETTYFIDNDYAVANYQPKEPVGILNGIKLSDMSDYLGADTASEVPAY